MTKGSSGEPTAFSSQHKLRLAYFVTHPIQYQAPLLRRIAQESDIGLKVFFSSDLSIRGHIDQEFGIRVQWDTPLLDGYDHEFLPVLRDAQDGKVPGFLRPLNSGIRRAIRQGKFNAVWLHGYHYSTNLQALWAANALKIPVLLRAESTLFDRPRSHLKLALKQRFFDLLRHKVSGILSVGQDNATYWRHYLGTEVPVFPCPYTVDNSFFQRQCAAASHVREDLRRTLGLEPGRPVVLFAAKLIPRKRCGDLLEAFLRILQSNAVTPLPYLLIVGEGEERATLEHRAKDALSGTIRFLGFQNQSELPGFYDLCNVFVLPSVDEPWGLAINEVMNASRAVIVSDQVGCQKDLVHHGKNGCVFTAGNIEALEGALRIVLANEQTWHSMGTESLRIIADYSFEQNVDGLRLALQSLVPGFPSTPSASQLSDR